jgi:hypothetical protein
MFVKSHPSKDITLEGTLKTHRPKWKTVADLALRAIGVEPLNPSEAGASQNFLWQARFHNHTEKSQGSAQKLCCACA